MIQTDIDAIRARAARMVGPDWFTVPLTEVTVLAGEDVPALLAALEAANLRANQAEARIAKAKAFADNAGLMNYEEDNYAAGAQHVAFELTSIAPTAEQ